MGECDQFQGRLRELCEGSADRPLHVINSYRTRWGLEPLAKLNRPERVIRHTFTHSPPPQARKCGHHRKKVNGFGPGSQLIKIFAAKGMPACQACYDLAGKMDAWGVDGCRDHFDEIVVDILPRAKNWLKVKHGWARKLFVVEAVEDLALKTAIGYQVAQAIKMAEESPRPTTPATQRKPYLGSPAVPLTHWSKIERLVDARADSKREELIRTLLANTEIVVKSFMRQDSLLRFVQSVRQFYPTLRIRVADDSPTLTEAGRKVQQTPDVTWHQMPFDQGLPAGRNLCVRESKADYVIVCDDDFEFTAESDLAALLLPLTADIDLCGGLVRMGGKDVKNWCGLLSIKNGRIIMEKHQPSEEEIRGVRVFRSDITYNFFAVRRDVVLRHPWDERFRITNEHLDSFLTWKQADVKVAYTVDCICNHPGGGDQKYKAKRRRNLSNVLHEKWKVSGRSSISATVFRVS